MGVKKVRGQKRLWQQIKKWEKENKELNVDRLQDLQRIYVKAELSPYSNYPELNIAFSEPFGKTRKKTLQALLNIYDNWHLKLQNLNKPYYLKIWLYEPFITRSQVVCATGDFIDFYEDSFYKPEINKRMPIENYGALEERMKKFSWEQGVHELAISHDDIGEPFEFNSHEEYRKNRKRLTRRIKSAYRTSENDEGTKYFFTKYGTVWIGGYHG